MSCTNGKAPCGMGLWEGVPLREVFWLAKPTGKRPPRLSTTATTTTTPKQRFQSSLPAGRVLEDPPGEHPVLLCYKLNDAWLTPKRGGPRPHDRPPTPTATNRSNGSSASCSPTTSRPTTPTPAGTTTPKVRSRPVPASSTSPKRSPAGQPIANHRPRPSRPPRASARCNTGSTPPPTRPCPKTTAASAKATGATPLSCPRRKTGGEACPTALYPPVPRQNRPRHRHALRMAPAQHHRTLGGPARRHPRGPNTNSPAAPLDARRYPPAHAPPLPQIR